MKLKSSLAICIVTLSALTAAHAAPRTVSAFGSFKVLQTGFQGSENPYQCLNESYGAVYNACAYQVDLFFDLPTDNKVVHTLKVQNYVNGTGASGATCYAWSYDGNNVGREGSILTFNPSGVQTLTFTSAAFGNSVALLCNVPPGAGIGALTYNP